MKRQKQGLTLIEILIALFIFSFTALYISRTVNHLLKRQKKTETHIKDQRSYANILEILRRDLQGVWIHLDMNFYLNRFALSELSEAEGKKTLEGHRLGSFKGNRETLTPDDHFINPQFDFFGEEDHLIFTTLIPSAGDRESEALVKVNYFSKQCVDRETGETASCLIRGVSRHWKDRKDLEYQKNRVLIRGLKNITFAYYHPEKKEWERTWKFLPLWKQGTTRQREKTVLLPPSVRINMEWEKGSSSHILPVSHPFLRVFRPAALSPLAYLHFVTKTSSKNEKDRDTRTPDPSTDQAPAPANPGSPSPTGQPLSIPQPPAYRQ